MEQVVMWAVGGVFAVLWYLLKRKDEAQEEQIKQLFVKHDEDAKALQLLQLQIASNHYQKFELDQRFDKLETTIRDGLRELNQNLGCKFDALSKALIDHMSDEKRGQ